MKKVIVIGAGASGMLAAVTAARVGASVTVLEGMEKPGKKLLLTGSGRCNLTNLRQSADCYCGADEMFINSVLKQFPVEKTLSFFREIGLLTYDRDGYVYPVTGQAASVLDVLLQEMKRLHIKMKCTERVTLIQKTASGFRVKTEGWTYEADAVILSAGSKAAPMTGSDGSGYKLALQCGHTIIPPLEALVPLQIKETWIRKLSGLRMPARIALACSDSVQNQCFAHQTDGELQWTDYGISGILVFQVSRFAVQALARKQTVTVMLDLVPTLTKEELYEHLRRRKQDQTLADLLKGTLPAKAILPLLSQAGLSANEQGSAVSDDTLSSFAAWLKSVALTVRGAKTFEQAQACQGGVDCHEVNEKTLESKILPGLYLAGELLDVDGICGGYNLQWAWSSGYTAGYHAGSAIKEVQTS